MSKSFDVIVLGAGGAGLMCAATAGQNGRRVLLLDHNNAPGKKILISGGGRCNFTNIHANSMHYLSQNRHFAKSALSRYTPQDFIALIDRYGIKWHEKTLGQLFCDGPAQQIVDMLMEECHVGSVSNRFGAKIGRIGHDSGRFLVETGTQANGETFDAPSLVIATGGPSIPKLGATGFAYDIARQFGLKIVQPRPALVPLTLADDDALFRELSGVSAPVTAHAGKASFAEAALFTHRGLSGPAILQISSYWHPGDDVHIDFAAPSLRDAKRNNPRATVRSTLDTALPTRLAGALADRLALPGELANVADKALAAADAALAHWRFHPNGSEGFAKAEVTLGGIATDGLSSQTMMATRVPGLYAIGEAVDVTGWLGGYNFQWAWASGRAAGMAV